MKKVMVLGWGTLMVFGALGVLLIHFFQDASPAEVILRGWNIPAQIGVGIIYGLLVALIAIFIISRGFFRKENAYYSRIVETLDLNTGTIIFLSLCAGIGEELFFRAGLQPLIGIWPTSFIFVFLHGYLNPTNWRISVYGAFMVVAIAGFGYLFFHTGLITVMVAHSLFDIILFKRLAMEVKRKNGSMG